MNWSDALSEPARPRGLDTDETASEIGPPLFASTGLHLVVVGILLALSLRSEPKTAPEPPPVTVELREPKATVPPPALQHPPIASRRALPTPPRSDAQLRMEPVPPAGSKTPTPSTPTLAPPDSRTTTDGRKAGGAMGGPLPSPTPGFPDEGAGGADPQEKSLDARLRSFRNALQRQGPPGGSKGGGSGSGGIDMPELPATGFGVGNLRFEHDDWNYEDYGRQIYWVILKAWYQRLYLTAGSFEKWAASVRSTMLDHQVQVRFTIQVSGEVTDIAVEVPAGCPPLDQSATDALRAVVLPKLPADYPRASETVHARFIMEGDTRGVAASIEPYLRLWGM
jgi:outer membrane biosynthesis protein TonB